MATVQSIITRAVILTGARSFSATPGANETAAALTTFQNMLLGLPKTVLTDVLITANYTAGENERITADSSGNITITIPDTVTDTRTGAIRAPHNGAVVQIANGAKYIYITETQSWSRYDNLALTDASPFGPEHNEGLAAMLAVRLYPVLQQDQTRSPSAVTLQLAQQGRAAIRQRFRQPFFAQTDPVLLNRFQRNGANQLL